jgi:hypothetical protein
LIENVAATDVDEGKQHERKHQDRCQNAGEFLELRDHQ